MTHGSWNGSKTSSTGVYSSQEGLERVYIRQCINQRLKERGSARQMNHQDWEISEYGCQAFYQYDSRTQ